MIWAWSSSRASWKGRGYRRRLGLRNRRIGRPGQARQVVGASPWSF